MADKIKGSTDKDLTPGRPLFFAGETTGRPATLVVHDHKHERVFTESEVRAIALKAIDNVRKGHVIGITNVGLASGSVARAFEDAGIVLDPA